MKLHPPLPMTSPRCLGSLIDEAPKGPEAFRFSPQHIPRIPCSKPLRQSGLSWFRPWGG